MNTYVLRFLLASLALLALSLSRVNAAVIVTLATPSTVGSIEITQDINFTITTAGSVRGFVFDEWVTSDGLQNGIAFGFTPNALSYSINAGATSTTTISALQDNAGSSTFALTPNDGYLFFNPLSVAVNDIFTVKAGTYTLAVNSTPSGFNPQANQTFAGNTFMIDGVGGRMSADTSAGAVPEASRALLLLGGFGALVFRRRRS